MQYDAKWLVQIIVIMTIEVSYVTKVISGFVKIDFICAKYLLRNIICQKIGKMMVPGLRWSPEC